MGGWFAVGGKVQYLSVRPPAKRGDRFIKHGMCLVYQPRSLSVEDDWAMSDEDKAQWRANLDAANRFERKLPTPEQVRAVRETLGWSQRDASFYLGGGPRSFQKYEKGTALPGQAMATLLWLLKRHPKLSEEFNTNWRDWNDA